MKILQLSLIIISVFLVTIEESSSIFAQPLLGGAPLLQVDPQKDNFADGELISITGHAPRNSLVSIILADNYGNIMNLTQTISDGTGNFNASLGIPSHVKGGSWSLFARSGENNFARQVMVNFHGVNTPPFNFPSGFPPLKQFKLGIKSIYIQCRSDLLLIIKSADNSPVCVRSDTAQKLIERGWAVQTTDSLKQWVKIDVLGLNNTYNVGKPISFSVSVKGFGNYPCVSPQVEIHDNKNPGVSILNDNGSIMSCPALITPGNYSFDFPGKNDYYVTSMNKSGDYTLTISYGSSSVQKYFTVILPSEPIGTAGLENDSGTVTLRNQTYYFETPNYTQTAYPNPVQFHDVVFTLFPSGFRGGLPNDGCGGSYYWTDAKFSDGVRELLHIFVDSQPCPEHPTPIYFSTHANPQAGLTFYGGKMKLMVSTNATSSVLKSQTNPLTKIGTSNPLGVTALVTYSPPTSCLGFSCPPDTFYLKINSNSIAYLRSYDICGSDLCVKNSTLSILLPINNIQIPNYITIGLSENKKWNYGDTADIRLEISPSQDGKNSYLLDIKNSTIVP